MREQIAEYLAQGLSQADVARILGCQPSTISEMVKTEGFQEMLAEKAKAHQETRLTKKYSDLEEKTLNALREDVPMADVGDKVRILESLSRIKNANRPVAANVYQNPTIGLTLVMPVQNVPKVITDSSNAVIAIGDRSLAPMPIAQVKQLFKSMETEDEQRSRPIERTA